MNLFCKDAQGELRIVKVDPEMALDMINNQIKTRQELVNIGIFPSSPVLALVKG